MGQNDSLTRTSADRGAAQPWGRETELQTIATLVRQLPHGGSVLHVSGPAGIGKSFLVAAAATAAEEQGIVVLRGRGAQAEAHLPFAALHQLLRPLLPGLERLPPAHRAALSGAFGLTEAPGQGGESTTDRFFIALAALELIADAAARQPVLVVADDVHWFDAPSRDVVEFLARRVESEPVAVLLTTRVDPGADDVIDLDVPLLPLSPLDPEAAGQVLQQRAPSLSAAARSLVLQLAEGNPLALVELPLGLEDVGSALLGLGSLPLTQRLERAFASRLDGLPALTRDLLLVAALQDSDDLASITAATSVLVGGNVASVAAEPARTLALIDTDGGDIRFRHPLVRSAVIQSASESELRAVHRALAGAPGVDPDRRAWHRAAAATVRDEGIASALQESAERSRKHGAPRAAQLWLERAAELSTDEAQQGHRLLRAAEIAFELGQGDSVHALLSRARLLRLEVADRARLAGLEGAFDDGVPGGEAEVRRLVAAAEEVIPAGENELAAYLLMGAARHCYWSGAQDERWTAVRAAADRVQLPRTDPRMILVAAFLDPFARTSGFLDQIRAIAEGPTTDGAVASQLALAAFVAADFDHALTFANRAATVLRQQGRVDLLVQAHVLQTFTGLYLGRWDVTLEASAAAHALATETRQPIWAACALLGQANLAGLRGDDTQALALADEVEGAAVLSGNAALLSGVQLVRGFTALGVDQPSLAFDEFRRMVTSTDPAYQLPQAAWAIDYLADAAVVAGRADEAREALRGLTGLLDRSSARGLRRAAALAAAVLADDSCADEAFAEAYALSTAASSWYRARLDLAHGSWLRRHQRVVDSRPALRAAKSVFDALGAPAWSARVTRELTASGERSEPAGPTGWARLSAQELQIARLAAAGLSNQDIAERLYLSHRTVASHLYRLFPKLGVRSRAQLHLALPAEA